MLSRTRASRCLAAAATLAAAAATSPFSAAAIDTWTGSTGSWSLGSNWSLAAAPSTGDAAALTQADALNRTVTLDVSTPALAGLTVDSTGAGHMTLSQFRNTLAVGTGDEYVGYYGYGEYDISGGANSLANSGDLYVGYGPNSSGKYYLSGPSTLAPTTVTVGNQYVGYQGTGSVTLSYYATVTSTNLFLAYAPGSTGSYSVSAAGNAVNTANAYIGGSDLAPGGKATLSVTVGTFATSNSFKVWNSPGTLVRLGYGDGNTAGDGTLSVGSLDLSGNPALLYWNRGTLAITGPAGLNSSILGTSLTIENTDYYFYEPKVLAVTNTLTIPTGSSISLPGGLITAGAIALQPGSSLSLTAAHTGAGTVTTGALSIAAGASVTLAAGSISTASLDTAGDPSRLAWTAGTLSFTSPAGWAPAANDLGTAPTITANQTLSVTNTLSLPAGTSLSLNGGSVNVGSLNFAGDPSRLIWNAGQLTLTGTGVTDLSIFGPTLNLPTAHTLSVTGTALLPAGVTVNVPIGGRFGANALLVDGGSFNAPNGGVSFNTLKLGSAVGTTGSFALSIPNFGIVGQTQYIGYAGVGSFTQSNGANNSIPTSYSLILGNNAGAAGYYSLSGAGTLQVAGSEYVGLAGNATFAQSGGTHTLTTNPLFIAYKSTSAATYSLSAGSLNAPAIYVGGTNLATGGAGTLSVTGGTLTTPSIKIWNDASLLSLTGGTLQTPSIDTNGNPNRFSFTGGNLVINSVSAPVSLSSVGNLNIGPAQTFAVNNTSLTLPANSTLSITGGSVTVDGGEYIATSGSASIVQTAGSHSPGYRSSGTSLDSLYLGYNAATTGSYSLSGTGTLAIVTGSEYVGYAGTGKFTQSGGTHSVLNASLYLYPNTGYAASYALAGGTLSISGTNGGGNTGLYVGGGGAATFTHTGGTLTIGPANFLFLGFNANTSGTYSLSSSGSLSSRAQYVGYSGRGTFVQSGGTNSLTASNLVLGNRAGSVGSYALSGNSLLSVGGGEFVGLAGTGTLTQSGGTNAVTSGLFIGDVAGSTGSYVLSAGSASAANIVVAGSTITAGGAGALTITGGSLLTPGTLRIWNTANTAVSLSAGSLTVGSLDTSTNPARFAWTGGTLSLTNSPLSLSPTGPLGAVLSLPPTKTLRVAQPMTVDPAATLSLAGGTLDLTSTSLTWSYATASPAPTVRQQLLLNHLTSSTLSPLTSLGYLDTGTAVLVQPTPTGDANLDGLINADDYALLDRGAAQHASTWQQGDFNYDGTITNADFLLIDTTYLSTHPAAAPTLLPQRESQFGATYVTTLLASVPEPTSLLACGFAIPTLLPRRRR